MGRVYSVSDGIVNNSSGVPYIMASPMDLSFQDVVVNITDYLTFILTWCSTCAKKILNINYDDNLYTW